MVYLEEGNPLLKLGKDFFIINPKYEHQLEVNHKFVSVLRQLLVDDYKLLNPLSWYVKGKDIPKDPFSFTTYCDSVSMRISNIR